MKMTPKTAEELFNDTVRLLPLKERLRLVTLILDEFLSKLPPMEVDQGETWSEEDLRELTQASLWYAARAEGES